ncbi:MAG TPA: MarR family transcriptional regulator [Acidobacteriota bacterium]|nr:MarR family transcriptional regulator [Acidobacteriota bacterium]
MAQVNTAWAIYRALSELARHYQFRNRDEICCYGLTVSQCYALQFLADREAVSSSELSAHLHLDLSSTTRLVDELVKKTLVTRARSEKDARVREIQITPQGQKLLSKVEADMTQLVNDALSGFASAHLKELPEILSALTEALNRGCAPSTFVPAGAIKAARV